MIGTLNLSNKVDLSLRLVMVASPLNTLISKSPGLKSIGECLLLEGRNLQCNHPETGL